MKNSFKKDNFPQIIPPIQQQGVKQGISKGLSFSNIEDDQEENIYYGLLKNFPAFRDLNYYSLGNKVLLFYFNFHWRPPKTFFQ